MDDYLTLNFTPVIEVSATLTTQPGNKLQYSFQLERFDLGANYDIGDIKGNIQVGKVIELVLFRPLGSFAGFLVDRHFEPMAKNILNDLDEVSEDINLRVKGLISRSAMIPIPSFLMDALESAISSCSSVNTLTNELSNIINTKEQA